MEVQPWAEFFQDAIEETDIPEEWMLHHLGQQQPVNFKEYRKFGKAKFECRKCSNKWSSMKGLVLFYYRRNRNTRKGEISMELFGQQCKRCKHEAFEPAVWYEDEMMRVLTELCTKISEKYYNLNSKELETPKRSGDMKKSHESKYCEGCQKGKCSLVDDFTALNI